MKIEPIEKDNFYSMVDSLKKCRRADLSDINNSDDIIERLYVDALDDNFVLKSSLRPNTTILIGRKGTGKSTIIARLQHEIRKSKDKLSLYIDVKTIFEQAKVFNYNQAEYKNIFSHEDLSHYLIYKSFLKQLISQIKEEVKTNTLKFFLAKISRVFGPDKKNFEIELENIFNRIAKSEFLDISFLKEKKIHYTSKNNDQVTRSNGVECKAKIAPVDTSIQLSANDQSSKIKSTELNQEEVFSEILLKCFNPRIILSSIKGLLSQIGVKYTFICLDDFSEIDEMAMRVFVDTIVSPLNNWSDEFFKFKIAAYPERIYLGDIDPQKIEQIKLDYYDLYQGKRVTDIQAEAQKSVKKLLEKRVQYFCKQPIEYFFDVTKNSMDDYYKLLFNITASVPRIVGWILWYAHQNSISKDQKITLKDLELASEKYYTDSILPYFSQNKFMREPFNLKLEKYHLKELLDTLISLAKQNKKEISQSDSKIFQQNKDKPFTSHFYIDNDLEKLMSSLELHFFITKYNEQKDQDSKKVMSFFSLNYGLCLKEDINYGRGSDRKYVIQRRFNYSSEIRKYMNQAKHIYCNVCNIAHSYELLDKIQLFGMLCPTCRKGYCEVKSVSIDLPNINEEILISEFDLNFLNSLKIEEPQYASCLAQELDCTYQKVSRRAIRLKEHQLISSVKKQLDTSLGERTYYYLTDKAKDIYFN